MRSTRSSSSHIHLLELYTVPPAATHCSAANYKTSGTTASSAAIQISISRLLHRIFPVYHQPITYNIFHAKPVLLGQRLRYSQAKSLSNPGAQTFALSRLRIRTSTTAAPTLNRPPLPTSKTNQECEHRFTGERNLHKIQTETRTTSTTATKAHKRNKSKQVQEKLISASEPQPCLLHQKRKGIGETQKEQQTNFSAG